VRTETSVGTADTISLGPLHQIALRADDLDQSIQFYRDKLGITFVARFDPPGLAFFDLAGVRLLLSAGASSGTVYFRVDDITVAYDRLRRQGVAFEDTPHPIYRDDEGRFGVRGHEEWMTFFRDPAGNLLALACSRPVPD
jgi:methylmalonyl-CoA/ethylmalonyl-CoA epimerase